MLRGLTTVTYLTDDLDAAKAWYAELLGIDPYFDQPAYAEFRVGDHQHELGLLDRRYVGELGGDAAATPPAPAGVTVYWHVDDVEATLDRLVALGATRHQPPRDFGEGFIGASVIDPFGNILEIFLKGWVREIVGVRDSLRAALCTGRRSGSGVRGIDLLPPRLGRVPGRGLSMGGVGAAPSGLEQVSTMVRRSEWSQSSRSVDPSWLTSACWPPGS